MQGLHFQTVKLSASLTRPANATAYTAGDAVTDNTPAVLVFANASRDAGRTGSIDTLVITGSANVATKPDLELWLFDTAPAAVADNAAFAPTDAEALRCVGVIPIPVADWKVGLSGADAAGNVVQTIRNIGLIYRTLTTALYGQLVIRNAYVPVSGEVFTVNLMSTLD